jgi:hypothetical protein
MQPRLIFVESTKYIAQALGQYRRWYHSLSNSPDKQKGPSMAQKIVTLDDTDSSVEAAETIMYGIDGHFYEIDLSEANATKLRKALDQYNKVARPIPAKEAARRAAIAGNGNGNGQLFVDPDDATIRTWAQANNVLVSDKGRVAEETKQRYRQAMQAQMAGTQA